jgi:hypothetical protein
MNGTLEEWDALARNPLPEHARATWAWMTMTTDQTQVRSNRRWFWLAGIMVLAGAVAAGLWQRGSVR